MDDDKNIKSLRILIFLIGASSIEFFIIFLILTMLLIEIPLLIIALALFVQTGMLSVDVMYSKFIQEKVRKFEVASGLIIALYIIILILGYVIGIRFNFHLISLTIVIIILPIIMFSLTKFILAIINMDMVMFLRIWFAVESILTCILSIIVIAFPIDDQRILIQLLSIILLLCGSSNMLYSILWKKELNSNST